MPELSTGLVIAGAYADKLRRTLFAQLRDFMRKGLVSGQEIARAAAEMNRMLYEIIVNELRMDKGDVVRIRVSYDVVGGTIKWFPDTLRIEAFRRIPDEEVASIVKRKISSVREGAAETGRSVETGLKRATGRISSASFLGETISGEHLFLLKDSKGENMGLAIVTGKDDASSIDAVIIPGGGAAPFRLSAEVDVSRDFLRERPGRLVEALETGTRAPISEDEARRIIQEKMRSLL